MAYHTMTYQVYTKYIPCHDIKCVRTSFSGCRCCQQTIEGEDDDMVIDRGNKVSLICPLTSVVFKEPVKSKVRSFLPSGSAAKRLGQYSSLQWQRRGVSLCAARSLPTLSTGIA